jgi:hypothetical protein
MALAQKSWGAPLAGGTPRMKTTMETFLSSPGISIPKLAETLRLARIALTAEEFDEWLVQISTAEQAGQEAAA